jgi:membrane protein YdbS with pleckstrin-like domain
MDFIIILINGIVSPLPTFNLDKEIETSFTAFVVVPVFLGILISWSNLKQYIQKFSEQYISTLIILFLMAAISVLTLFPEIMRLKMSMYAMLMYGLTKAAKETTENEA